jgi:hypothetical protein
MSGRGEDVDVLALLDPLAHHAGRTEGHLGRRAETLVELLGDIRHGAMQAAGAVEDELAGRCGRHRRDQESEGEGG